MISSEVQRTLVKSPPELWAELSEATSLARHLGELGEIRITRSEPEKRVEWEAEGASGSVLIKPSGWGTKVTLSVTREVALPEPEIPPETLPDTEAAAEPSAEASLEADPELALDATPPQAAVVTEALPEEPAGEAEAPETPPAPDLEATSEPAPEVAALSKADDAPETTPAEDSTKAILAEADPEGPTLEAEPIEPEPRPGFFARLFGRRKPKVTKPSALAPEDTSEPTLEAPLTPDQLSPPLASGSSGSAIESLQARFQAQPAVEIPPAAASVPAPGPRKADADPPETEAIADPPEADVEEAPVEALSEPEPDLAAELKAAEEVAVEEVTALLTGVLDRLGAAHHRPFSRS